MLIVDFQTDLHGVKLALVKFKHQQDTATQLQIARHTILDFLQSNEIESVLLGQIQAQDQEEEDIKTI